MYIYEHQHQVPGCSPQPIHDSPSCQELMKRFMGRKTFHSKLKTAIYLTHNHDMPRPRKGSATDAIMKRVKLAPGTMIRPADFSDVSPVAARVALSRLT